MRTKITFFGTPEFAVPALTALLKADFCEVELVVTQPDKPVGRHHSKFVPSPIKQIAQEAEVEVYDGPVRTLRPKTDIGVLVAYGEIIPQNLISAFPLEILNIHPSLLPKYRGSSPIQAAILNQDIVTGVTLMKLDDKMDHGPIVAQERVRLNMEETAGELNNKLAMIGAQLLIKTLPDYIAGKIKPQIQDDTQATYTGKLTKESGRLKKTIQSSGSLIRAMNPWPGAWTEWQGKKLIIWSVAPDGTPQEVQLEGKKKMLYEEFKRGHPDFKLTDFS